MFAFVTPMSILPTSIPPLKLTSDWKVDIPETWKLVVIPRLPIVESPNALNCSPTFRFFSTPSPPSRTRHPVSLLVD